MSSKSAKIVAVSSVKGGSGKSVFAINLAYNLSLKYNVLIIDLDLYTSSINLMLDIEHKKTIVDLSNDLDNNKFNSINDYIVPYNDTIDVLGSINDIRAYNGISVKNLLTILNLVRTKYDFIIVDTSHIMDDLKICLYDNCATLLLVFIPDLVSLRNLNTTIPLLKRSLNNKYRIILNNSTPILPNISLYEVRRIINNNIDHVLGKDLFIKNINSYFINGRIPFNKNKKYKVYTSIMDYLVKLKGGENE